MKATYTIGMTLLAASLAAPGVFAQAAAPRARAAVATMSGSYLGIGVQDVDAERAKALKLRDVRGAEITSVAEESPAAKAGIKDGDVILEFNDQPASRPGSVSAAWLPRLVGRQVSSESGAMALANITATVEGARAPPHSSWRW